MRLEIHNFTQNEIDRKLLQKVSEAVLKTAKKEKYRLELDKIEISLAFVGDGRMKKLNKLYRNRNRTTDVLSFANKSAIPYLTKGFPRLKKNIRPAGEFVEVPDGVERLGEIVICYPRAKKQARRAKHSLKRELTILLIHGILHLLGYDHEKGEKKAKEMEEMERRVFKIVTCNL